MGGLEGVARWGCNGLGGGGSTGKAGMAGMAGMAGKAGMAAAGPLSRNLGHTSTQEPSCYAFQIGLDTEFQLECVLF